MSSVILCFTVHYSTWRLLPLESIGRPNHFIKFSQLIVRPYELITLHVLIAIRKS